MLTTPDNFLFLHLFVDDLQDKLLHEVVRKFGLKPGLAQFCTYTCPRQSPFLSLDQGECITPELDSSCPMVQAASVHLDGNHLCLSPSPW